MRQRILDAAAWWAEMGSDTPTKVQVGLVAGYKITSKLGGKFGQTLARLVDEGAIAYPAPGCMTLTSLGATEAATPKIPRSAAGVQSAVMAVLDPMEQRILRPILDAHPDPIGKVDAGLRAGYEVTSKLGGKFGQSLARLKTLTIVTYPAPGQVRAADWLFLG